MKIFADQKRLQLLSWNVGHGNKILHLLFLLNLATKWNADPVIPCISSLDEIFDLSEIKTVDTESNQTNCLFKEKSAFLSLTKLQKLFAKAHLYDFIRENLTDVLEKSQQQLADESSFLNGKPSLNSGFISGHFWHYDLMPSEDIFLKFVSLKQSLVKECLTKYPDIQSENSVAVHLRDTDFKHHERHIFRKSIALPERYYLKAIEQAEKMLGKNLTFHLFSDNTDKITKIFKNYKVVLHQDNAPMDWICIFLGRNVIQSNSSFCWTASLYNKKFSVQPEGGYNWGHYSKGSLPFGFAMPLSMMIECE